MAVDIAKLVVSLEAQNGQILQKLSQTESRMKTWEKRTKQSLSTVANSFKTILGGATIVGGFRAIIKATGESEKQLAQLDAALKSTGGAAGFTSKQIQDFASQLQSKSTFDDEAIINLQTRMLSFGKVTGDSFKRATQATVDLATRLEKDLGSSALLVGKALNDPIKGLAGLSRAGITFTAAQKEVIKSLAESGKMAEAQGIILGELEKKFGGAAQAARDTMPGALAAMRNAFGNLLEAPGGVNDATQAINDFTATLENDRTKAAAANLSTAVIASFAAMTRGITISIDAVRSFGEWIAKISGGIGGAAADSLKDANAELRNIQERIVFVEGIKRRGGMYSEETLSKLKNEEQKLIKLKQLYRELERDKVAVKRAANEKAPSVELPSPKPASVPESSAPKRTTNKSEPKFTTFATPQTEFALLQTEQLMEKTEQMLDEISAQSQARADILKGVESLRMESLTDEARAVEILQSKYIELESAVSAGVVSQEQAAQISAGLAQQWADAQQKTAETVGEMSEFAAAAAENIQSAFADFLFDPFEGGLKGMLKSFAETMRRMAAEALSAKILDAMIRPDLSAVGGKTGGLLTSLFSSFLGGKDSGGRIPSGKFALVGERRPELVSGPANVFSGANTGALLQGVERQSSSKRDRSIRIVNAFDTSVIGDYLMSSAGEKAILNVASRNSRVMRNV